MPGTQSPARESARLAALKAALLAERRLLELDTHSVLVRAEQLLGDAQCEKFAASDPIGIVSQEPAENHPGPGHRGDAGT